MSILWSKLVFKFCDFLWLTISFWWLLTINLDINKGILQMDQEFAGKLQVCQLAIHGDNAYNVWKLPNIFQRFKKKQILIRKCVFVNKFKIQLYSENLQTLMFKNMFTKLTYNDHKFARSVPQSLAEVTINRRKYLSGTYLFV